MSINSTVFVRSTGMFFFFVVCADILYLCFMSCIVLGQRNHSFYCLYHCLFGSFFISFSHLSVSLFPPSIHWLNSFRSVSFRQSTNRNYYSAHWTQTKGVKNEWLVAIASSNFWQRTHTMERNILHCFVPNKLYNILKNRLALSFYYDDCLALAQLELPGLIFIIYIFKKCSPAICMWPTVTVWCHCSFFSFRKY